ncbi:MAG TPA: pimeloyl-ACP methyl ester esterase BioH [Casimicrobiaceae bacterium]
MSALHVETAGHGPPLVLLHGWAMHSGVWGPLVAHLAKRYRVHAVDLPGHGHSKPIDPLTLDSIVDALETTVEGSAHPLTVLGWSFGGMIALHWARARPERIARLVLVCTTPRFVTGPEWPHAISVPTLSRFGDELHIAWKETVQRFLALQITGGEHARALLTALRAQLFVRGEPSPRVLAAGLVLLQSVDLRTEVGAIGQPTLVIVGSRDTLTPPAAGAWLAANLPHARFTSIDGAAHTPFLSHREPFETAVDDFLEAR